MSQVVPELDQERDFISAESFEGSKEGYMFQLGEFGLGEEEMTVPVSCIIVCVTTYLCEMGLIVPF